MPLTFKQPQWSAPNRFKILYYANQGLKTGVDNQPVMGLKLTTFKKLSTFETPIY